MRHEESILQRGCVEWFRWTWPRLRLLLVAVPNGGKRPLREAQVMKAEGVTAGVADLVLFVGRRGFHGLCVEMKTAKGRQSEAQRAWQRAVEASGYRYVVCRGFEEFQRVVGDYLEGEAHNNELF